jgi:hypothetical protein
LPTKNSLVLGRMLVRLPLLRLRFLLRLLPLILRLILLLLRPGRPPYRP